MSKDETLVYLHGLKNVYLQILSSPLLILAYAKIVGATSVDSAFFMLLEEFKATCEKIKKLEKVKNNE